MTMVGLGCLNFNLILSQMNSYLIHYVYGNKARTCNL